MGRGGFVVLQSGSTTAVGDIIITVLLLGCGWIDTLVYCLGELERRTRAERDRGRGSGGAKA